MSGLRKPDSEGLVPRRRYKPWERVDGTILPRPWAVLDERGTLKTRVPNLYIAAVCLAITGENRSRWKVRPILDDGTFGPAVSAEALARARTTELGLNSSTPYSISRERMLSQRRRGKI